MADVTAPSAPEGCTQFCFTTNQKGLAQNIYMLLYVILYGWEEADVWKIHLPVDQFSREIFRHTAQVHNRKHFHFIDVAWRAHACNWLWGFLSQPRVSLKTWVMMKSVQHNKGAIHLSYVAAYRRNDLRSADTWRRCHQSLCSSVSLSQAVFIQHLRTLSNVCGRLR